MRTGIELTPLTYTLTGVGYYVRHLVRELSVLMDTGSLKGFIAGIRCLEDENRIVPHRRFPVPPRLLNTLWNRIGHPRVDVLLGGVDVYHAVNYVLPPLKSARSLLSVHDLGFLRDPAWCNPKTRAPFHRTIQVDALRADTVIACSQATKNDVVSMLGVDPERVQVIYDAADDSFVPVDRDEASRRVYEALGITTPYLLFVSTVELRKNIKGLLSAFSRADIPHKLVLAGALGWGSETITGQVEQSGLTDRVVFTGYISKRSLFPCLYSAADAFVFPSWHEGFGLAVLEAMACGCPVIASNTSSLSEVGGNAPIYVDPRDVDALARSMELVTGDRALREAMCEKGITRAGSFSWRKCAEETLACYKRLT